MAMTPEKREANRKRREEWIPARIDCIWRGLIVKMDKGSIFIDVEVRNDAKLSPVRDNELWKEGSFDATADLPALAEFIRALSARYNAAIETMNSHAAKTQPLKSAEMPRVHKRESK